MTAHLIGKGCKSSFFSFFFAISIKFCQILTSLLLFPLGVSYLVDLYLFDLWRRPPALSRFVWERSFFFLLFNSPLAESESDSSTPSSLVISLLVSTGPLLLLFRAASALASFSGSCSGLANNHWKAVQEVLAVLKPCAPLHPWKERSEVVCSNPSIRQTCWGRRSRISWRGED